MKFCQATSINTGIIRRFCLKIVTISFNLGVLLPIGVRFEGKAYYPN
jgi:hypothetical protein